MSGRNRFSILVLLFIFTKVSFGADPTLFKCFYLIESPNRDLVAKATAYTQKSLKEGRLSEAQKAIVIKRKKFFTSQIRPFLIKPKSDAFDQVDIEYLKDLKNPTKQITGKQIGPKSLLRRLSIPYHFLRSLSSIEVESVLIFMIN